MIIKLYIHGSSEQAHDAGQLAGLSGKALQNFRYANVEHAIEYEVDEETGTAVPISLDGRKLEPLRKLGRQL